MLVNLMMQKLTQTHLETLMIMLPVGFTILYIGFPITNITEIRFSSIKLYQPVCVGRFHFLSFFLFI